MATKRKCPNCRRRVSGHPNKKFCGSKCKDRYHNRTNPRGIQAYRNPSRPEYDPVKVWIEEMHPMSSEALGQD